MCEAAVRRSWDASPDASFPCRLLWAPMAFTPIKASPVGMLCPISAHHRTVGCVLVLAPTSPGHRAGAPALWQGLLPHTGQWPTFPTGSCSSKSLLRWRLIHACYAASMSYFDVPVLTAPPCMSVQRSGVA